VPRSPPITTWIDPPWGRVQDEEFLSKAQWGGTTAQAGQVAVGGTHLKRFVAADHLRCVVIAARVGTKIDPQPGGVAMAFHEAGERSQTGERRR